MSGGFAAVGEGAAMAVLTGAGGRFNAGLAAASHMAGQMLVSHCKSSMAAQGVPSGPGEHPAVRTGQLIGSIDHEVSGARFLRFGSRGAFNDGFDYAVGLHEGTSKMAPRPYLTLSVNALEGQVRATLGAVTWRYIVGGG